MTAHVEARGISKRFGGVLALDGIDLAIEHGSIHALVGENGAGKSTLGKIIAGVHRPDVGELWVDGRRVDYRSPRRCARGQDHRHRTGADARSPPLGAGERVPRRRGGGIVDRRATTRRFARLVEDAGIELSPRRLARTLTVADQQKVEILRAMARDARLIIMDEPTSALTADESERLFELIRRLRERGATIVYVSHFLPEVLALADTVTVLRDGKLVQTSAAADETPDRLVTAMLGRPLDLTFPDKAPLAPDAPVVLSVRGLVRPPEVQEVSFEIRAGEIVGLAGLIGSGRSEVARAIFGADRQRGRGRGARRGCARRPLAARGDPARAS